MLDHGRTLQQNSRQGNLYERQLKYSTIDELISHLGIVWWSDLFAVTVITIEEGRILAANPYFCKTVEHKVEELIGRTTTEVGLWPDARLRDERVIRIRQNKSELNEVVTLRTKSGRIKHFLVSGQLISIGNILCAIGTGTDITTQIDTENELLESRRCLSIAKNAAENASRAKSAFLANMSHEIRTPLSVIQGFVELLLEEPLKEKQRQHLKRIQSSTAYLRELIDKVLDISKIEAREESISPSRFVFGEKVKDVLDTLAAQAERKNIAFITKLDSVWNLPLHTDHVRLLQIITNLCSNAIKFTAKGRIEVTGLHEVRNNYSCLVIRIADTGIGIPREKQEQLFKIFTQVHSQDFGGTGIGLYLSRQLARKLGGNVELIESRPGLGSIFEVCVCTDLNAPEEQEKQSQSAENNESDFSLEGLRIVAAEDNEPMRMIISTMVELLGGQTKIVRDGIELVTMVKDERPDVILLDNRMPRLSGAEAARILRENGYKGKMIALTASAFEQERSELIEAGCDDVLTKPFNLASFTAVLKKHVNVIFERYS